MSPLRLLSAYREASCATRAALFALAFHIVGCGVLLGVTHALCMGNMSYPLDDAFIHLALAKTLSHDHIFGITRFAFTNTSSSVLWPFLLAPMERLLGVYAAFLLAAITSAPLAFLVSRESERLGLSPKFVQVAPFLAILLAPTPMLSSLGMEHGLHLVATFLFVARLDGVLREPGTSFTGPGAQLLAVALLPAAVRYEGLFLVALGSVALALNGRFKLGAAVAALGVLPVVGFGLWSLHHGALFLPYSVVMKGARPPHDFSAISYFAATAWEKARAAPALTATMALALFAALRTKEANDRRVVLVLFGAACMHLLGGAVGWFFRYEAYLVVPLAFYGAAALARSPRSWAPLHKAALAIALLPMALRSVHALGQTPRASRNIFQQQVQMARFVAREFPGEAVAVNDIGAVAYFHDGPVVDLMGLANGTIARERGFRIASGLPAAVVAHETAHAPVAVLYSQWFVGQLPNEWTPLHQWTIRDVITPAFATITIYATRKDEVTRVTGALASFEQRLPNDVTIFDLNPRPNQEKTP